MWYNEVVAKCHTRKEVMEKESKNTLEGVEVAVFSWETLVELLADKFDPDKEVK
jgi:hypothetical protein